MNSKIEEKILNNHNEAGSFVSLFFLAIDVIIYVVIFNLFGFNTKNISSPKLKLYLFILLDGISRIINAYTDVYIKTFLQETTFSLVATIQFVLSLAMFEQIFTDKNNDSFLENELKIRNKFFLLFYFFVYLFLLKEF